MEDVPPSYSQSMNPSVLDIVAPYLDTLCLHALTLVSRSYNATFMPHLWGSPASHFVPMDGSILPGDPDNPRSTVSSDDMVYVALTRFKRVLRKARLSTRQLVHTLFLPPALSEIYGGPNATWLREILEALPNLQSLCVGGLPFFDHHSLDAVNRRRPSEPDDEYQTYPLKLLIASKEPNCTSFGLSIFLPRVRHLIYLDLSYTTPARDTNVLASLAVFSHLQVLKMRGIGLRDPEAEVLANAIGLRVRLLDIAENLLSDMSVRSLLQACVYHPTSNSNGPNSEADTLTRFNRSARRQLESWPVSLPPAPDFLSLDILRSSNFDKNLRLQLTRPLTGRLAFEDIPHGGLTHLYITGNPAITIEGIRSLLDTGRLHVLDAGEIAGETVVDKYVRSAMDTGRWQDRPNSVRSTNSFSSGKGIGPGWSGYDTDIQFPGAEKLIPVLRQKASKNLTFLRIDHAIITKEVEITGQEKSPTSAGLTRPMSPSEAVELSGQIGVTQKVEIPGDRYFAVEMPTEPIHELDGTPTVRAELPGDIIHFAISPPVNNKPADAEPEPEPAPIRGEGPYAPEVAFEDQPEANEEVVLDATGSGIRRPAALASLISPPTPQHPNTNIAGVLGQPTQSPARPILVGKSSNSRQVRIGQLLKLRPPPNSPQLHPATLPNLRTLKLTNIPPQVPAESPIIKTLIRFITYCATESQLSILQAKTDYSLPPGRARLAAEREHARSLFALQTIFLEIGPASQDTSSRRDWKHTRQRLNISKSSTGDMDSEALWTAASNDFSFFGEEGEEQDECGIYEHEPGKYFPTSMVDEKFLVVDNDGDTAGTGGVGTGWSNDSSSSGQGSAGPVFQSPRQLPLGKPNRRSSAELSRNTPTTPPASDPLASTLKNRLRTSELPGTIPDQPQPRSPQHSRNTSQMTVPPSSSISSPSHPHPPNRHQKQPPVMVDTVAELSKFRKERKAAYEAEVRRRSRINGVTSPALAAAASASAETEIFVEGYWKGEIKVIRTNGASSGGGGGGAAYKKPGPEGAGGSGNSAFYVDGGQRRMRRDGEMTDYYGNLFSKGYLYA